MHGLVAASNRVKPPDGFSARQPVKFIPAILVNVFMLLWLFVGSLNALSENLTFIEFDNMTLKCPLVALNASINWTGNKGEHLHTGQNFSKSSIKRNMSGIYKCRNSSSSEHSFNVIVQYGAEGDISSKTTNFTFGQKIEISCQIDGVPPVSEVVWFFRNRSIDDSCSNISGNISRLKYRNASCDLQGNYTCSPRNTLKENPGFTARNGSTIVHVKGCPVSSTTVSASDSTTPTPTKSDKHAAGIVILGVFVGVLVVAAAVGAFLWLRYRRCQCCCKKYCNVFFPSDPIPPDTPTKPRRPSLVGYSKYKHGAIPVENFAAHVKLMHTDGDYRFNQEFESLQSVHVKSKTWINSEKPENQSKNRYNNIVAYDHSRVILSLTENEPDSHYINGNYVDSFKKVNAYIATQGPMANTIKDFWRMVWEQNCTVVVMITNIIEKGRHKCAMYWPSKQAKSEAHGPLRVTYLDEEAFAHYTLRRFEVKPVEHSTHYSQYKYSSRMVTIGINWDATEDEVKPMIVCQYHFTGWPDHGAPDHGCEYPALDFIFKSSAASQEGAGPIIVHCSAGVGRSGAYIVIHSMMKRMIEMRDVNIFDFVAQIRQQRNHLVQEECQYIFVHDALLHFIESGFQLSIPIDELKDHVQKLRKNCSSTSGLEVEFEDLSAIQVRYYNLKQAKRGCNLAKNRSVDYIPADSSRVELYPRPREEGSDYINATYLAGFWKSEAYIATQYPLAETTDDFWRMVWQENCRSLVMLLSKAEMEEGFYHRYLPPLNETTRFGDYEVTADSEATRGDILITELRMVSIKDPSEYRNIQHFHFLHWPEDDNPWSGQTILQLICKVDSWEREVRLNAKPFEVIGPVVVHCNYGVGRTGAYCLLHTMYHQIEREKSVSIYQIARLYNHQRPRCVSTLGQYEFCYDTLVEYIEADCSLHLV
ncbi:receptor-type tyrosine-protein phosphatase epsilon-like isoform X4 [Pocillopora verrucosa]|uniref:receptor-type tyrosine-protein phosphatase epsilon-like isoform X4 n=1 Tax=Pocillopora verrucosa TaxID=203993 RepID=UPI00333FDF1F